MSISIKYLNNEHQLYDYNVNLFERRQSAGLFFEMRRVACFFFCACARKTNDLRPAIHYNSDEL